MTLDLHKLYDKKDVEYFGNSPLPHIRSLIPDHVSRVLEIGCGTGATLHDVKVSGICDWTAGVEFFPEAVGKARLSSIGCLVEENIEELDSGIAASSVDLILCLDVLEHL